MQLKSVNTACKIRHTLTAYWWINLPLTKNSYPVCFYFILMCFMFQLYNNNPSISVFCLLSMIYILLQRIIAKCSLSETEIPLNNFNKSTEKLFLAYFLIYLLLFLSPARSFTHLLKIKVK